MHFVLVGPGALGCLLASRLATASKKRQHRFTLIDHNSTRAQQLNQRGILYSHKDRRETTHIPVSSSPTETGRADVVILCVKSYDIENCLRFCSPLIGEGTILLFMQNGISHIGVRLPVRNCLALYGTTTEGATLTGAGEVFHAGKGLTQVGFLEKPASPDAMENLDQLQQLFNSSGLKTRVVDDILSRLWTKLLVNTGINGLTATLNCTNGELLTLPGLPERMERLVAEAYQIAHGSGIHVPEDSFEITKGVCVKTSGNISSMLQDVRKKRRTEIEAINGAVVTAAKKLGIDAPENQRIVREVKQLERQYLQHAGISI
ncbi:MULTISPECIES: ketopantoate reductase family protein [Desulfosediminicola]|uniref:ketopantoate reductase family protein n=1 Tax=Desulfosediminicola TaxID=2886823 RepID=UPI0010ABC079|nr:2-dehydropantoate 2-reductase [Desulfosediminicola ganghwensis]